VWRTDGQTHRQTPYDSKDRVMHSVARVIKKTDTNWCGNAASLRLRTVPPRHWWRSDEHLGVSHDTWDPRQSSSECRSPRCSNRRWARRDKWSQQDNLHSIAHTVTASSLLQTNNLKGTRDGERTSASWQHEDPVFRINPCTGSGLWLRSSVVITHH